MEKRPDLKTIFRTPGLFVGILDEEGKLIDANQESLDFIDRKLEDVQGKKFWNTPWWDHSEKLREKLKEGMKKAKRGEAVRFEADHLSPEGKRITVDLILRLMELKTASNRLLALGRDITERKELESRQKLVNSSLNQAALEVFWITPGGKFEYTNRKVREKRGPKKRS